MTAALIVGAGSGLSASLARLLAGEGYAVGLAARDAAKLGGLAAETGGAAFACDA
ncbi:MAG: oxidoreductase, partial [Rhodospirillaceae bacterium]|nr:oxidoreductase [Rhodospirillaceae bacterium]